MRRFALLVAIQLALGACGEPPDPAIPEPEDVAQQQTYSARGLWTYPNTLSEIPDGAFSRADNAVIRREGVVETRRGFKSLSASLGASSNRFTELGDFGGTLVAHTSENQVATYNGTAWSALSGTYTPPAGRRMRFLKTGKSLYFTTTEGVKRLDEVGGTVYDAGVPQAIGGTAALDSNGAHATGTVTLSGGAGDVTVTIGGTAVGPVAFTVSDAATATATIAAINANTTVAALVTASSGGSGIILLTAEQGGTAGNSITLTASRTAGSAAVSGATLAGGSDGSGWFPADAQTAYRFVWGFRNANDRVLLGAPSGRVPLTNPSTETLDEVTLTVQVPSWVTTSHFLQVYRADTSAGASIPASDDMGLVYEAYPTTAEVAARSMTIPDVTPDELKGAALYSSPNAGVPGSEKLQPPVCTDLAEYKERMWCATTVQRQRLPLTLLSVDATSGGLDDGNSLYFVAAGYTAEKYTAGTAENVATKTFKRFTTGTASQNVANTAQSLVTIINSASAFMYAYYISGEYDSPGQIVMEHRTLGATEVSVLAFGRSECWTPAMTVVVDGYPVSRTAGATTVTVASNVGLSVGQTISLTGDSYSNATDETNFPPGSYTISALVGSTQFTYIDSTPGNANALDTIGYYAMHPTLASDPTDAPNGLAFSEFEEPDAVPLGHYMAVGSPNFDILRILTLGDTLFIFKEEAIYTLTGDTPATFSVRQFPTPAKLVAAETAVVLGNAIYVLTDQGVMAISESGSALVSRPIEGTLVPFYDGSAAMKATLASTAFAVSYETEREYHLFLPTSSASTYATQAYVYNYVTKAWTRWDIAAYSGYVLPSDGKEYLGKSTANVCLQERKARTVADYEDEDGVAITMAVDWQIRTGDNPGGYKHWQKTTVMVEQPGPTSVTLSIGTEVASARASGTMTLNGLPYVTSYVPVDQSRSQSLTVGVAGGQVNKLLALKGLSVDVLVPSTKLR